MEAFFSSLEAEVPHIAAEGPPSTVAPPLPTLAGFAPIALKSTTAAAAAAAGAPKVEESKPAPKPQPRATVQAPAVGPGSAAATAVVATPLLRAFLPVPSSERCG